VRKVLQLRRLLRLPEKSRSQRQARGVRVHNDSLLAVFTGPTPSRPGAEAAEDVLREFAPVGERWKTEYGLAAAVAGGLHLGEAVFGAIGAAPIALGDCVSVAERMVHRARSGEIVISLDLMKGLGPAVQKLPAHELPPLELGKRPPIPIYGMVVETRLDFT
jgi:class 3 adenylate cyclase